MSNCDPQLLSAYHDGELDAATRQRVEVHLRDCPACAEELQGIRDASQLIAAGGSADHSLLTDEELARVHDAIDDTSDRPILRIGAMLGAAAASLLIVSCAWLMDLPRQDHPAAPPPISAARFTAPAQPWEEIAVTLRPEIPMQAGDDLNSDTYLADAKLAEWMLQGLNTTSGSTSGGNENEAEQ
jgi:anti-sigma factor RsiW